MPDFPITRRHKYGAVPTIVDGIRFASKREAKRYGELKILAQSREIFELRMQWKFPLHTIDNKKVSSYIADFVYLENGKLVVEDVKGVRTPLYRLKRKWLKAEYGIVVKET